MLKYRHWQYTVRTEFGTENAPCSWWEEENDSWRKEYNYKYKNNQDGQRKENLQIVRNIGNGHHQTSGDERKKLTKGISGEWGNYWKTNYIGKISSKKRRKRKRQHSRLRRCIDTRTWRLHKKVQRKTDYSDQRQYRQRKQQQNKNNQITKMGINTAVCTFQVTNKQNLTREDLDVPIKRKP